MYAECIVPSILPYILLLSRNSKVPQISLEKQYTTENIIILAEVPLKFH